MRPGVGRRLYDYSEAVTHRKARVNGFAGRDIAVDAAVYYELSKAITLQVNIENLLDETYFPDAHSNDNISTGEPINARFSMRYRF